MSNIEDYQALLPVIMEIPAEEIKTPTIPMEAYNQEADDLEHWIRDDKAPLLAAGLSEELYNGFPVRVNASREAQSRWHKENRQKQEAQRLWNEKSPTAYNLRDELVHTFRYAFRKAPELLAVVNDIAEGNSHADMIQDLNDLAVLGRDYTENLQAIGFAPTKLETAANLSTEMGDLLAEVNGERRTDNEVKTIRDRAYTYLKEAVDEIRECGKFVFWNNPNRLEGYYGTYSRKIAAKHRAAQKEQEQEI